jgi:adenosylcobinamide kinase/adenosylcobinamide-phosphate guanylyltransferase
MFVLLTGGSANGKSFYAERLLENFPEPRCYIAAMKPLSEADRKKILEHRNEHEKRGFVCMERFEDVGGLCMPKNPSALLECICHLTSNEMFKADGTVCDPVEKVVSGVLALSEKCKNLIVVTNEVGSEHGDYDEATKLYVEALGKINAMLAAHADAVYELVCGIPAEMKAVKK